MPICDRRDDDGGNARGSPPSGVHGKDDTTNDLGICRTTTDSPDRYPTDSTREDIRLSSDHHVPISPGSRRARSVSQSAMNSAMRMIAINNLSLMSPDADTGLGEWIKTDRDDGDERGARGFAHSRRSEDSFNCDRTRRVLRSRPFILAASTARAATSPEMSALVRITVAPSADAADGVVATITSVSAQPEISRSANLNGAAAGVFPNLPAGAYVIAVRCAGFHDAAARITFVPGTVYEIVAELASTDQNTSVSSLALVRSLARGTRVFDRTVLDSFPADDATATVVETAVAPLIVSSISNGGLRPAEPALIGGNGSGWRQTSVLRDGLEVTDPLHGGTPLLTTHHLPLDAIVVSTSSIPASAAGAGALLSLIPRTPGTIWSGASSLGFIPEALQSNNAQRGAPSMARFAGYEDWTAEAGGPLGARADVFVSTHVVTSDRLERDDPAVLHSRVASLSADARVAAWQQSRLRFGATFDRTRAPSVVRARFPLRDATRLDTFSTLQATWERWTTNGTGLSASTGVVRGVSATAIAQPDGSGTAVIERLRDGPVSALFEPSSGAKRRWSARLDIAPAVLNRRHHAAAAGITYSTAGATLDSLAPSAVAESVDGLPARVWDCASAGETDWSSRDIGAYVLDRIALPRRVSIELGSRLDATHGSARGSRERISWLSVTPRAYTRWMMDAGGRYSVFGGYAWYGHRLPLDYLAFGDPAAVTGRVFRWNDTNANGSFDPGERGELVAATGPCCAAGQSNGIDPRLDRPFTSEWVAGAEARIAGWSVRVAGVRRLERRLIGSVNIGVTAADYEMLFLQDAGERFDEVEDDRLLPVYNRLPSTFGRDRYVLTNPDGYRSRQGGVEITAEKMFDSRL
jgi:hypothetical protein